MLMHKGKKGGVVTSTVLGIGGLIIAVIITLVILQTLDDTELLTAGENYDLSVDGIEGNFTDGLDKVSAKLPTILLIVAVVFLFGALILLVRASQSMGVGGGSSL